MREIPAVVVRVVEVHRRGTSAGAEEHVVGHRDPVGLLAASLRGGGAPNVEVSLSLVVLTRDARHAPLRVVEISAATAGRRGIEGVAKRGLFKAAPGRPGGGRVADPPAPVLPPAVVDISVVVADVVADVVLVVSPVVVSPVVAPLVVARWSSRRWSWMNRCYPRWPDRSPTYCFRMRRAPRGAGFQRTVCETS